MVPQIFRKPQEIFLPHWNTLLKDMQYIRTGHNRGWNYSTTDYSNHAQVCRRRLPSNDFALHIPLTVRWKAPQSFHLTAPLTS